MLFSRDRNLKSKQELMTEVLSKILRDDYKTTQIVNSINQLSRHFVVSFDAYLFLTHIYF